MNIKKQDIVYVPVDNYAKKDVETLLSVNGVPYKFRGMKDVYVLTEDELKNILHKYYVNNAFDTVEEILKSIT